MNRITSWIGKMIVTPVVHPTGRQQPTMAIMTAASNIITILVSSGSNTLTFLNISMRVLPPNTFLYLSAYDAQA